MKTNIKLLLTLILLPLFVLEAYGQGFKLPWNNGVSYYVSRTGTPAPTGGTGSTCGPNSAYNGFSPHGYVAIDFDSPNGVYDPVRAVKAGVVVFAGISGSLTTGYGRLVRIRHSDNTQTYYAHNQAIYVTVGQYVQQGCLLADGGNTGNSFGDHIHFEWKDVGGVAFSDKRYPSFLECGCKVKPKYCYKSTNTNGSCSGTPCTAPSNDNCSSATTITSNGSVLTGTVACATGSFGANQCAGCNCSSPDDLDVYYKFVAQATSHTVTLSNYASNFDGVIELRSGCGLGTNIGCYDPSGIPSSVTRTFSGLTIGQTYYVRVYEWDNSGTPPSSPTFKIKVTHVCPMPGSIASILGSINVCKNTSQTYSVPPVSGATSYTWTLPSGWTGSSTSASINTTVGNSGGQISVKANNACGSSNLQTIQTGVNELPATPSIITGNNLLCQGASQENYSISPVNGATSFIWTLPSGWTGSSTSTLMTATTNGTGGTITVKANNGCGDGPTRSLTVGAVNLDNTVSINSGELTSNATSATYQWIDCVTMYPINGATQQSFTPTQNGSYAVVINKDNCVDTSACYQVSSVGLSYADKSINLVAYPNPTHNKLTISANGLANEKHNITFTNSQGQILIDKDFKVNGGHLDEQFDIGDFPSGLYFMTIRSGSLNHVFKIEKL
ncbi:MAG TPA: peptidoglycan DD-metalloendopeptidase family protein [Brumimicrobium sp.]|nr:peptidoglycan DD-metalloendopeptidase family protein [Brumimicrobium sp.]